MTTSTDAQQKLERIIDAVAESYGRGRAIDSLESTALPNSRLVIDALGELEHVIYLGFYSNRELSEVNLRHHIGEHLYAAMETLVVHVARAVVYERWGGGEPDTSDLEWSENTITEVLAQIPELRCMLQLDVEAAFAGDPAAGSVEEIIFSYPGLKAITIHRIAHEFAVRKVPMIPRIMAEHAHSITGIDIHPGAQLGKRFFIDHGTGVVIGETTTIGEGVKLYQGVTLGALSIPRDERGDLIREAKRHPTLEDGVTVYAGATILGGDTVIGAGSVVGANVWLTESVPPNTKLTYTAMAASESDGGNRKPA